MQLRLPVVVVGGGLTAIDTATEALAYYPVQVEKFLSRYEALVAEAGRDVVESAWTAEERTIADEFLAHARAIRGEREAAAREGREARIVELLQAWGGATIAYRRRLIDSPSYTLNHEEVEKALEEGIRFAEGLTPLAVEVDAHGHACALRVSQHHNDGDGVWHEFAQTSLPARAILVAAGTQPNTVLAREDATHFISTASLSGARRGGRTGIGRGWLPPNAVLTGIRPDGRATSFFGDLHPSFHGNVVKAMASAKHGYPIVSRMLDRVAPATGATDAAFFAGLNRELRATVVRVERLTPTIVEVVVRAPAAARRFQPGQFYRLQNFETLAPVVAGTRLAMEGLALTGAWVDRERGLVAAIVLEMGGSSDLCALLKPGEPVVLMGPTGAPTEIRTARPSSWWVVASATRCSSRSAARCAQPDRKSSTSPATSTWATATGSRTSRPLRTWWSGAATKRPAFPHAGRRTAPSSATSSRRCSPTRRARSARNPSPSRPPTASSPSAPTR
jgi:hypothetical protein